MAVCPSGIECSADSMPFPGLAGAASERADRAIRGKWRAHARGTCAGARRAAPREDGRMEGIQLR